jgi:hypothetical protein
MFSSNEERKYFLTLLAFAFILMILSIADDCGDRLEQPYNHEVL